MKKFLSVIIAIAIVVGTFAGMSINFTVSAEGESNISQSTNSNVNEEGFIEVDSIEDLYLINQDLTANYILTADIDLTEATAEGGDWDFEGNGWNPIGSANIYGGNAFSGEFDGNGHKIIGMRIDLTTMPVGITYQIYLGLFAKITGYVHDLTIEAGYITSEGDNYTGRSYYAGALAGSSENATIANIHSKMQKIYFDMGDANVYNGGIIGYCTDSTITCCSNNTKVYSAAYGGWHSSYSCDCYSGGIIGFADTTSVTKCYNVATISSIKKQSKNTYYISNIAGGIGGYTNDITIKNCYNTGEIISPTGSTHGIIYIGKTEQCYNVGNLTNSSYGVGIGGDATDSYYLSGTGKGSTGATSLTKGQMLMQTMYLGFDFDEVWTMNTEAIYPYPQLKDNIQNLRVLDSVELASSPNKIVYEYDEELNVFGAKINVKYTDGSVEQVVVTDDMVSGYDANTSGEQEITVTYIDNFLGEYVFSFNVVVKEAVFVSVKTAADLFAIKDNPSANYRLENDIDLTEATTVVGAYNPLGTGWTMIPEFSGVLDGNGYSIIGMNINGASITEGEYIYYRGALFNTVSGKIINLTMKDVNVFYRKDYGVFAASIALTLENSGIIDNCAVYGIIDVESDGGGCSGFVSTNNGTIKNSYNHMKIEHSVYSKYDAGSYRPGAGIALSNNGMIIDCYNTGEITGSADRSGICSNNYGSIINSYNVGNASYAITQSNSGTITNCYYLVGSGEDKTDATPLTEEQMKTQSLYAGFDFENVWVLDSYANHPYPQLKNNIQDLKQSVEVVRIIALPEKTEYYTGDKIDLTGLMVEVVYISGKTEIITVTEDMISGFDSTLTGEQTVTVTFDGQTSNFNVNVEQRPAVSGLTLVSQPDNNDYLVGTAFDFSGAKIKIEYENGDSEIKDVTVEMTTGGNINVLGKQTIVITVESFSVEFDIVVSQLKVMSIKISKLPNKLTYLEGEELSLEGMNLVATYNNGNTLAVTSGYSVTGYEKTPGTHTVEITYFDKTVEFTVVVKAKSVVKLELRQEPFKKEYFEGDDFETDGIVIVATYDNGEVEIVEDYTVSGFDGTVGIKTITLSYGGKAVSCTVQIFVLKVTQLVITQMPAKLQYIENEPLDTTGLQVTAMYNNGDIKEVTDYQILGFSSTVGTHTVSIMYEGETATYDITVVAKQIVDVVITLPTKLDYYLGEEFDDTGLVVTACFDNGQRYAVDNYIVSGFDTTALGTKVITVSYGGIEKTFSVVVLKRNPVQSGGSIKLSNVKARLGEAVEVPVEITQNPGLTAFCHTITFDATALEFVSATAQNGFKNGTVVVNDDKASEGEVTVLWFQATNVTESGVAYNLTFKILETANDGISEIAITFDDNDNGNAYGEDILFGKVDGSIEVLSYWLGDLNGDRVYTMVDIVQLSQYVSGKEMTLSDKQKQSADVNEDGVIDIHDITLLSQWLLIADM